jgi:hypothetical protein
MRPRDLWARYRQLCCVGDSVGVNAPEVRRIPAKTPRKSRDQAS